MAEEDWEAYQDSRDDKKKRPKRKKSEESEGDESYSPPTTTTRRARSPDEIFSLIEKIDTFEHKINKVCINLN